MTDGRAISTSLVCLLARTSACSCRAHAGRSASRRSVRRAGTALCTALGIALAASAAPAQTTESAPPTAPALTPEQVPWPIALGMRTAALERSWPIVDQVVLVPDGATYLDEISRWSEAARWPVLFEDDLYAPLFVRGFEPKRVVRRASVGALAADRATRESLMRLAAADAISDGATDIVAAAGKRGFAPSMVIVSDATDTAWPAAVALAAGRGAPIRFTSARYGMPGEMLEARAFERLADEVESAAAATGLPWKDLGDAIDAFVICAFFGDKCDPALDASLRLEIPSGPFPTAPGQPLSTVNALGRHADGRFWAMGSGIFGSEARAAYTAMSSLFAPRKSAWLVNGYSDGPGWRDYAVEPAKESFDKSGLPSQVWSKDAARLSSWRMLLMGGFGGDALIVNSHGTATQFGLYGETTAGVGDVPLFDRPAMVHFLHSFSLEYSGSRDTVGGRFLDHGAYAYFGSVYEPLLNAFVTPKLLADRSAFLVPFLISSRVVEGSFARPWRTSAYGDPLALLAPPERIGLTRVAPPDDGVESLASRAAAGLGRFRDAKDTVALVSAMKDLELLGDDAKLVALWSVAKETDASPDAAPHALGALFRARKLDEFAVAFAQTARPNDWQRDMLWHLATPRLGALDDARIAALLGRNARGPDRSLDLANLKPAALRLLGRDGWNAICDAASRDTTEAVYRSRVESVR